MMSSRSAKQRVSPFFGSSLKRGRMEGTCTTAKHFSPLFSLEVRRTARFRLLFASVGNGRLLSTASGVSTGNRTRWKYSPINCSCSSFILSGGRNSMSACFLSAGRIERYRQEYCLSMKACVFSSSAASSSFGVRPESSGFV